MTAATGKQLPVGLRSAIIFALTAAGFPAGNDDIIPYEGVAFSGPKAFTLTIPEPRKITHTGGDRPLAVDYLPPTDAASGELRVADYRQDIHAILTGVASGSVGEAVETGHANSKQGFEPQVGLLLYQQSLDLATGARRWRSIIIPKALCIPQPGGFADSPQDVVYKIAPQVVTARLWGDTLVLGTDGYESAQFFEYMTENPPKIISFLGDGAEDEFSFPAGALAKAEAKVAVFKDGVAITGAAVTITTAKVTFTAAPALNSNVTIFYETA
jgi:hypothetical protein